MTGKNIEYIYDEEFEIDGHKIRFAFGYNVQEVLTKYLDRLLFLRQIPMNIDNFNVQTDPVFLIAYDNLAYMMKGKDKSKRTQKAKQIERAKEAQKQTIWYYQKALEQAKADASVLTIAAHPDNKFDFEPKPYPAPSDNLPLPGMEDEQSLPEIVPDISNPLERRVKQIVDLILSADKSDIEKIENVFTVALMNVEREAESGFQPRDASGDAYSEDAGDSVEQTA